MSFGTDVRTGRQCGRNVPLTSDTYVMVFTRSCHWSLSWAICKDNFVVMVFTRSCHWSLSWAIYIRITSLLWCSRDPVTGAYPEPYVGITSFLWCSRDPVTCPYPEPYVRITSVFVRACSWPVFLVECLIRCSNYPARSLSWARFQGNCGVWTFTRNCDSFVSWARWVSP